MIWKVVTKVIKIKLAIWRLERAKLNGYRRSRGLPPRHVWFKAIPLFIWRCLSFILLRAFCWCLILKRKKGLSLWESLWTNGTFANSTVISLCGFLFGLLFTHLITLFLIFQLNVSPYLATYGTWFSGIFMSFGFAFSPTTRLFAFLTLPQFFTRKGRAAILAYAIILAVSGPGKNTAYNMEVLTESVICTQEMAKNATAGLVRLVKDPLNAIGKAMKSVVDSVLEAAENIKNGLGHLIRLIKSVVNVIIFAYDWLKKIVEVCNSKVGTPFDRCWKAFDEAIDDCEYQLGSIFSWMCSVVNLVQHVCYAAKIVDLLCWLPSLVKNIVFKPIKALLSNFLESVKTFFDVRIPLPTYKFGHSLTSSKKFREVIHDMKEEVTGELQWLFAYLDWLDFLVSFFLFMALYKAIIYRRRFLHMDRHDNYYLTRGLVRLDLARKRAGKQTIFPLSFRESMLYVTPWSCNMIKEERTKFRNSVVMVTLGAAQIVVYILLDVGLYLFLELVRKYGSIRLDTRNALGYNVKITGTGFMADMYRAILKALSPIGGLLPVFDTTPCLPVASVPNYVRYVILVLLILLCYFACLTEPYLLRFRHAICGMYYPERITYRDLWLYAHILKSRGSFALFALRELKARLTGDKTAFKVSLWDRLSHTIPGFRYIAAYFGPKKKQCFLCGKKGDMDDSENFYQCPICNTIYCMECFNEMGKQCPAHNNVFQTNDESSEEKPSDTSEDEKKNKISNKGPVKAQASGSTPALKSKQPEKSKSNKKAEIKGTNKNRFLDTDSDTETSLLLSNTSRQSKKTSLINFRKVPNGKRIEKSKFQRNETVFEESDSVSSDSNESVTDQTPLMSTDSGLKIQSKFLKQTKEQSKQSVNLSKGPVKTQWARPQASNSEQAEKYVPSSEVSKVTKKIESKSLDSFNHQLGGFKESESSDSDSYQDQIKDSLTPNIPPLHKTASQKTFKEPSKGETGKSSFGWIESDADQLSLISKGSMLKSKITNSQSSRKGGFKKTSESEAISSDRKRSESSSSLVSSISSQPRRIVLDNLKQTSKGGRTDRSRPRIEGTGFQESEESDSDESDTKQTTIIPKDSRMKQKSVTASVLSLHARLEETDDSRSTSSDSSDNYEDDTQNSLRISDIPGQNTKLRNVIKPSTSEMTHKSMFQKEEAEFEEEDLTTTDSDESDTDQTPLMDSALKRKHITFQERHESNDDCGPCSPCQYKYDVEHWMEESTTKVRPSTSKVCPGIAERVKKLDSFYLGMPYPPHTNIYKDD